MQVSGWFVGAFIIAAVAVVTAARWLSKRNILSGRKPISLVEMYQQDATSIGVSYEVFEKVLDVIGQAYRVDPRMLRLSDKLKALYDLDSWDLGEGTEELNERVAKDFGIVHFETEPKTIAELISEIEKQTGVG